jgi:hypothetical protein
MMRRPGRRAARRVVRRRRRRFVRRTVMIGGMVMLAAAGTASAIKLSKQDAQRIEEHTGMPPEQLEDEDLNQAMQELNIQSQPLTPEEQAALAQQEGAQPVAPTQPPAYPPAAAVPQKDYIDEIQQLAGLRDRGIITTEEFEAKKKQLLGL